MAKPRRRLRAVDHQPEPRRRFYIHKPETKPVRRTVRNVQNPWHEGLDEAKRAGAALSRGRCLFPAKHTTERVADVATDHRTRKYADIERKLDNRLRATYRKWGLI